MTSVEIMRWMVRHEASISFWRDRGDGRYVWVTLVARGKMVRRKSLNPPLLPQEQLDSVMPLEVECMIADLDRIIGS